MAARDQVVATTSAPACRAFRGKASAAASQQSESAEASGLTFEFETKPEGDPPLFLQDPRQTTASTNAGDYRLYVGGGAINKAFLSLLKQEQGLECEEVSEEYAQLHRALLHASRIAGKLVSAAEVPGVTSLLGRLRLAASFAQVGRVLNGDCTGLEGGDGSVFIYVFDASARPLHANNVAMLYVVGPKGEGCNGPKGTDSGPLRSKGEFLGTIKLLARQALEAVANYNRSWATSEEFSETRIQRF